MVKAVHPMHHLAGTHVQLRRENDRDELTPRTSNDRFLKCALRRSDERHEEPAGAAGVGVKTRPARSILSVSAAAQGCLLNESPAEEQEPQHSYSTGT